MGTATLQDKTVTFPKLDSAVTREIRHMILQFTLDIQNNNTTTSEILYNPFGINIAPWSYSANGLGGFELQNLGNFLPQRCFLTSDPLSSTSEIRNTLIYTSGSPTVARYDAINYVISMTGSATYANGKILVSVFYNY